MVNWAYCLRSLLLFDMSLLYYCKKIRSPIICYLFSRNIYLSFGFSITFSSVCESASKLSPS